MSAYSDALYQALIDDLEEAFPGADLTSFPPESQSSRLYAAHALFSSFMKKFVDDVEPMADERAIEKFMLANDKCASYTLTMESSYDEILIGEFRQAIWNFFNPRGYLLELNPLIAINYATQGPGSSVGSPRTDFYTKMFSSQMACTNIGLYNLYRCGITGNKEWEDAENIRLTHFGRPNVVAGNRLHCVPKRTDISRVIAVEPSLNMFFQKGIQRVLELRLKEAFNLDLSTQPDYNRELSRLGSINGNFATLDLESASDSISLGMVRMFFPRSIVDALEQVRSPCIDIDGRMQELAMISSMGNATTFPLETITFACCVSATYKALGIPMHRNARGRPGNFAVFGDDIIVVPEAVRPLKRLLSLLGFSINSDKSFDEGPFRESCGADYFLGSYVRPVYLKSVRTKQDRVNLANLLNEWTSKTGIPLRRALLHITSKDHFYHVPLFENSDAGLRVPCHIRRGTKPNRHIYGISYRKWANRNRGVIIKDDRFLSVGPDRAPELFNPYGLLISAIGGYTRGNGMLLSRSSESNYQRSWNSTSHWDWVPAVEGPHLAPQLMSLAEAIQLNIA